MLQGYKQSQEHKDKTGLANRLRAGDLTGKRFGRLVVIRLSNIRNFSTYWLCKCNCGKEKEIIRSSLIRGLTNSCGCIRKETRKRKRTEYGFTAKNTVYGKYKKGAEKGNFPFELSFNQ